MKRWLVDLALVWLFLFGVWPFADPGHDATTLLSALDLMLHLLAAVWLWRRWRIVRRQHPIVLGRVTDDGRLCTITVHTDDPAHIDALEANGWAVMP